MYVNISHVGIVFEITKSEEQILRDEFGESLDLLEEKIKKIDQVNELYFEIPEETDIHTLLIKLDVTYIGSFAEVKHTIKQIRNLLDSYFK